jgi:hypothetical protein
VLALRISASDPKRTWGNINSMSQIVVVADYFRRWKRIVTGANLKAE